MLSNSLRGLFFIFCLSYLSDSNAQDSEQNANSLDALASEFSNMNENLVAGRFAEGDELVISATLTNIQLGTIIGVAKNESVMFDFEDYIKVLDFSISYDPINTSYIGWFISEDKSFNLNIFAGQTDSGNNLSLKLSESEVLISENEYEFIDDRLYIAEEVLSSIFELNHNFNFQRLAVRIVPKGSFPLLDKLKRENARVYGSGSRTPVMTNLPRYYEVLSPQIIDIQTFSTYRESTDKIQTSASIQGARDIALLHTQLSLTANSESGLNTGRLNFSRESLDGQILGDTGITRFEFGDVRNVRQAQGTSLSEAIGVKIGNTNLNRNYDNERINIDGDVPDSWDVELYRNGVLVSQQLNVQSGRYEFLDTPLLYGRNDFEIILYGPQGQIRTRTINRFVDESINSEKNMTYEASITKAGRSLLGLNESNTQTDLGYNLSSRASIFSGNGSSLNVGLQSQFGGDIDNSSMTLGASKSFFNRGVIDANLSYNNSNQIGFSSGLRFSALGQAISAGYGENDLNAESIDRRRSYRLTFDGNISPFDSLRLPMSNEFQWLESSSGNEFQYSNSLGLRFGRFSLFNNIDYTEVRNANGNTFNELNGGLNVQANFGTVFGRLGVSYSPDALKTITSLRGSLNFNFGNNYRFGIDSAKDMISGNTFSSLIFGYSLPNIRFSGRLGHSSSTGFDLGLNASFSLSGHDAKYPHIEQSALSSSSSGHLAVRVFFDKNLDGIFDEEEDTVLPNVEVQAVQFFRKEKTNFEGVALLQRLPSQRTSDIILNRDSLPESFLVPFIEGVSITARAGLVDFLDYPVVISSEIEGLLEADTETGLAPLVRMRINLLNTKGEVVAQTLSEFDGYYIFAGVLPGKYTLQIEEEDYELFDLKAIEPIEILSPDIPDILTQDIKFEKREYYKGYISGHGRFNNKALALLYADKLKTKLPNTSFYVEKHNESGGFYVFSSFHPQKQTIEDECSYFESNQVSCIATIFKFKKNNR
ncbi:carboxypeptidase regulatory-like domain-containing protein [Glaciecola sp. KUL10]|uniref:carboxypeptidase regulatory-like domain-containing protein n=1 Tax=Glaciecola sp. (strain KUL10) TaxID=2161813 RepID=UPI000D782C91|nr:carboxypeptidase regulatory-like domain-containing protein [Glaciecola sp. KUL10]GBL03999.1 von Willebrand factor type A domain protein [Glaciecola sp. KUL10]